MDFAGGEVATHRQSRRRRRIANRIQDAEGVASVERIQVRGPTAATATATPSAQTTTGTAAACPLAANPVKS